MGTIISPTLESFLIEPAPPHIITVEMEAAAFFAVSKYYDIPLAQLLYVGDDVSGEKWDTRNWDNQKNVRSNLLFTAIKLMEEL